jgi:hypothetical protein
MARFKFPILGQAYESRSINQSAQRSVNCYPEVGEDGQIVAMYGTPGSLTMKICGTGPIRGMISSNRAIWVVSGNEIYYLGTDYKPILIGVIQSESGFVSMATSPFEVVIVDGKGGYVINLTTLVLQTISTPAFPNGVRHVTYIDGYFVVSGNDTGKFYICGSANSGIYWDATEFATAEGSPDNTTNIIANHRELWIFGTQTVEIWINSGGTTFPFVRSSNVFIEHGLQAEWTVSLLDNTIFWFGKDKRGGNIVYKANGYIPERISTHAIEHEINNYPTVADAFSFSYQQEGHYFYVLTFPSGDATWVYDVSTGGWHERAWLDPKIGKLHYWRPTVHEFFNGKNIVGTFDNGIISSLELDVYTDNFGPIKRIRSTSNINDKQLMQFFSMLQIQMETGSRIEGRDNKIMLRYSNDSGHTWSYETQVTIETPGEYTYRVVWWKLGCGRNRVWEISMTAPIKFAILGAVLEGEVGNS